MTSNVSGFLDYAACTRETVERALLQFTELDSDCPPRLREAMRYSLLAKSKRLRPLLVLMAAEACGSHQAEAMPAAVAVEMIHTYSLIHDDLPSMDDDDLRRGQPSSHKQFDEGTAILAGDALLTLAFEVVSQAVSPPAVASRCCGVLAQAAGPCGMVGGQVDDLADGKLETLEHLMHIHARKTGALFRVSLKMGGLVANATNEQLTALDTYGSRIGLAFQIVDDLLDVRGDEATLGKRTRKDDGHGKLTYPGLIGIEGSEERANTLVNEACDALVIFDDRAEHLVALARYVVERNR